MDKKERRRLEMFRRVRDFGAAHKGDFPADSACHQLFAEIGDVVSEIETKDAGHTTERNNARHSTAGKQAVRQELVSKLSGMQRVAKSMSRAIPGLATRFKLPGRLNDQALLSVARSFAEAATPLRAEFIRYEMPAEFLDTLQSRIAAFQQQVALGDTARSEQRVATSGIDDAVIEGREIVNTLDGIIRLKYTGIRETLRKWEIARHVESVSRSSNHSQTQEKPEVEPGATVTATNPAN
ncbi:MAG: hypothetical protein ACKV2V_18770 [Blastocatellia bacterium]